MYKAACCEVTTNMNMKTQSAPNQKTLFLNSLCLRAIWVMLVYSPWVWIILFSIFVLGITFQVGHLPYYGQPDPKYAGAISMLYGPTIYLLLWVLVSPILALLILLIKWMNFPQTIEWPEVKVYLLGLGLFHALPFSSIWRPLIWTLIYGAPLTMQSNYDLVDIVKVVYYAPILALFALLMKLEIFPRPTQWRKVAFYVFILALFYLLVFPIGADLLDWLGD